MNSCLTLLVFLWVVITAPGCSRAVDVSHTPTDAVVTPASTPTVPATAAPAALPPTPAAPTATARTLPESLPTAPAPGLLPHALYFLSGPSEAAQVWRLETDGLTRVQMTHESRVEAFAVSPADGSLAIVSDNQLFLLDASGANRRLIANDHAVDKMAEDYVFRGFISSPVFSPDGQILAYAFNGLHLYHLASGEDEHVLTNLGNLLGETFVFTKETYAPGAWSPDGSQLLIIMGYSEGSTLAVMDLEAAQPFTRLRSDGPVCCLYSWSADGRSVLAAQPDFDGNPPGLWRFDAATGEAEVVVPGLREDGSMDFVGWPLALPHGDLLFFEASLERFNPEVGIPLKMVSAEPDGSHQTQLRPEEFRVSNVLWAPDGSFALVVQRCCEGGSQIVLARSDESPLQVLVEAPRIRGLAWGR